MDFYELMARAESVRGESGFIDLSSGSPWVLPEFGRVLLSALAAPRWIDTQSLGAYADYDGIPAFIELICTRWSPALGRTLLPAEVMVTPGAQGALTLVRRWIAARGRRILYPLGVEFPGAVTRREPAAGTYASVSYDDGTCRVLPPEPDGLDWSDVGAVILSQPHNPTTVAFTEQELEPLLAAARRHDAVVVFDRTYALPGAPMALDVPALPIEALHIFSFSKVGLAGERTGILVGPEQILAQLRQIQRETIIQTPKIGQCLAAALLDALHADPALGILVGRAYQRRWAGLADSITEAAGCDTAAAAVRLHVWQGGPFLWAELNAKIDMWELADSCLHAGVAIMPGAGLAEQLAKPGSPPVAALRLGLGHELTVLSEAGARVGRILRDQCQHLPH